MTTTVGPSTRRIDLNDWRGAKSNRVLAGREYGETARAQAKISQLDKAAVTVEVLVPEDYIAVSSSFFRGMFGDSIRSLGESEFRKKFLFFGKNIDRVKEDGIRDALREAFPLQRLG
jgi:hypothetical protein